MQGAKAFASHMLMTKNTHDDRREALRRTMNRLGLNPHRWATMAGIPEGTLRAFLSGRTTSMRGITEEKLAGAVNLSVVELFSEKAEGALSLPLSLAEMPVAKIVGVVEAGAWREAINMDANKGSISFVPHQGFPSEVQFAMRVSGESCNRVIQDGGTAIVVPYESFPGGIEALAQRSNHPLVVFERERSGNYEYTIKELHRSDDGFILKPVSDHPDHQSEIELDENGDTDRIRIAFVVVSIQNLVF